MELSERGNGEMSADTSTSTRQFEGPPSELSVFTAYSSVLEELRLRPVTRVAKVNLNVLQAVTTALGVAERVETHRDASRRIETHRDASRRIETHRDALAVLPGFEPAQFGSIRRYAHATVIVERECSTREVSEKTNVSAPLEQIPIMWERFSFSHIVFKKVVRPGCVFASIV